MHVGEVITAQGCRLPRHLLLPCLGDLAFAHSLPSWTDLGTFQRNVLLSMSSPCMLEGFVFTLSNSWEKVWFFALLFLVGTIGYTSLTRLPSLPKLSASLSL